MIIFTTMKEYIEQNRERFFEELFSVLRIPSVSAKAEHKADMYACADRLCELLMEAGADSAAVYETDGHPVVFGQKMIDPKLKTVLVYGHYDVQPVEPLEKWRTDPFEPVIGPDATGREAIWGRGANDDKGQLFMHIKAFEYLVSTGQLKDNVKFLFEGEEEIGSPSLPAWIKAHKKLLAADICLVSDTTMISEKVPSINCGMRGLSYLEVKVVGPNKDLHSGHYGGAVANPIQVLCEMISTLIDADGRVTVPGFYDKVVELSRADRKLLAKAPFDLKEYKEFLDIDAVRGEKGYTTQERTGIRPCLPSEAHAKISMRLVPNQRSGEITKLFERHFKKIAPKCVKVEVKPCEGGDGFLIPISSSAYKAASRAIAEVYGIEPVPSRGGGSIAVLAEVQKILGIDPSYLLKQFFGGMESIALFYKYWE